MFAFDSALIFIILVVLIASTIRSAFGFGDALIAMPLLAFFLNMKTAVPVVAFIGFSISIIILFRHWRAAYIKGLWILILFCILGIPIGLLFLENSDDKLVKIILSVIIIFFSTINLIKPNFLELKSNKFVWLFGLVSGILGGAYNTNGPPVIIYGKLKRWEPKNFRAILQTVFLPTNLFIIIGQGSAGFWTGDVLIYFLISIPVILVGTVLGGLINKKLSKEKFVKFVDILLIIIGLVLFVNTVLK